MNSEQFRLIAAAGKGRDIAEFQGELSIFYETGYGGPPWCLTEDDVETRGRDALHILESGDHLTVYNADETVRWQGLIELRKLNPTDMGAAGFRDWMEMFLPSRRGGKRIGPFRGTLLRMV